MSQPAGVNRQVMRELRKLTKKRVLSHKQWDAELEGVYLTRREIRPAHQPADTVVQHITVTKPSGDFAADVRTLERIGWERFRTGISYNWVVDMSDGTIGQGAYLDAQGAHTINDKGVHGYSYNQNEMARAIAVIGMPTTKLSWHAEESIVDILVAMWRVGAITSHPDYVPHSMFAYKDCPCEPTRTMMPAIYRKFQKRIGVVSE
jgi:hypothetical protein